jgi:type II secretory pathway component PulM
LFSSAVSVHSLAVYLNQKEDKMSKMLIAIGALLVLTGVASAQDSKMPPDQQQKAVQQQMQMMTPMLG